jgi:hypothetical protein
MLSFPHGRPESHILLLLYSHFLLPRLHAQNGNRQNHQTHQNRTFVSTNKQPLFELRWFSSKNAKKNTPRIVKQSGRLQGGVTRPP